MNKYEIMVMRCEVLQPIYNDILNQMDFLSDLDGDTIIPPKDENKLARWKVLNELKGLMETLI